MTEQLVRTRFAPSPTGTPESIHLGFVIRALWNYAYAKKRGGQFVLRIEDTDQKRSRKDTEDAIYEVLKSFGIQWDEGPDIGGPYGPYRQSERLHFYQEAAHKLVEKGYAYYDFDAKIREKDEIKASYTDQEKRNELMVRPSARNMDPQEAFSRVKSGEAYVVRVKMPENRTFVFDDWILGKPIQSMGKDIADLILLKSDGYPTYHLAVVVDDVAMKISHVFRGQEWISTTPIHLFLYEGLGYSLPQIGHFSVIIDPRTGKKFSKRDLTSMFGVQTWLDKGYLPEALLNYLMMLGWAPKDNRELFTLEEFVQAFDQNGVQKANPTFDINKLDWFNGHYIRQKSDNELFEIFKPYIPENANEDIVKTIIPLIKERLHKLSDFQFLAGFFFARPQVDNSLLSENYKVHFEKTLKALEALEVLTIENLNERFNQITQENSFDRRNFFMDLRIAMTGQKITPPLNESMVILGKEEVLSRLNTLI